MMTIMMMLDGEFVASCLVLYCVLKAFGSFMDMAMMVGRILLSMSHSANL